MIRHIVMWKFRLGEEKKAEEFLSHLAALQGVVPELLKSEVRKNIGTDGFDAVLISEFASMEALDRYKKDQRHVEVSALCKSIREARASVDYEF